MRSLRFIFAAAALCGFGFVLLTWLLGAESLAEPSFRASAALSNFLGFMNIVPYLLSAVLSGSEFGDARGEIAYWALVFTQWAAIGIGVSVLIWRFKGQNGNA